MTKSEGPITSWWRATPFNLRSGSIGDSLSGIILILLRRDDYVHDEVEALKRRIAALEVEQEPSGTLPPVDRPPTNS